MQNDVKQVDREAGIRLAEHVLRNLSDRALRDVNPNDVFQHMSAHRIASCADKDAEISALNARIDESEIARLIYVTIAHGDDAHKSWLLFKSKDVAAAIVAHLKGADQ